MLVVSLISGLLTTYRPWMEAATEEPKVNKYDRKEYEFISGDLSMTEEQFDEYLAGLADVHDPNQSNENPHSYLGEVGDDTYYLFKNPEKWVVGVYEMASVDNPKNTDVVHIDNVDYHDGPHVDREYLPSHRDKKIYLPSLDDFDDAVTHMNVNWEVYVQEYREYTNRD